MKYLLIFFVFVVFCVALFKPTQAQTQEKVIVVSEKVGEVIDAEERARFNLWPEIKGFISAVFLQLPDGNYVAEVTYEEDGEKKKVRTPQSKVSIASVKYNIENNKKIKRQFVIPKTGSETKEKLSFEYYSQAAKKAHISSGRTAGEFFAGLGAGAVVGTGGFLLVVSNARNSNSETGGEMEGLEGMVSYIIGAVVFGIAYPVGTAVGVYFVGNTGDTKGNFLATLGGSAAGGLIGAGLAYVTDGYGLPVAVVLPPAFATIVFNATAKNRNPPPPETGFINFKDDRLILTVPSIYYTQEITFEGRTTTQNVTLVKINF